MELLNEIRFYKKNGKFPKQAINEAIMQMALFEDFINEGEIKNSHERIEILNAINNDDYIVNDYDSFLSELPKNKRYQFLTPYTKEDFENVKVTTYQVKGYEIGFALKPDGNDMDIISVHNNTNIGGIGKELIKSAIRLGGTELDNFDGYLSDFYSNMGFKPYEDYDWNDDYAPKDWDYETYGKPKVIMRRLEKDNKGL